MRRELPERIGSNKTYRRRRANPIGLVFHIALSVLAELLSKTPHAYGTQHQREKEQAQEIWPEIRKAAALKHAGAGNNREVVDWGDDGYRLQPRGHGLHRIQLSSRGIK